MSKSLESIVKTARNKGKKLEAPAGEPTLQLLLAILWHGRTRQAAEEALDTLLESFVDLNELRISTPDELMALLPQDWEDTRVSVARMQEALHLLYAREREVSMASLNGKGKRQIQQYLQTMPSLTPDMVAHVLLFGFGAHAIPVDTRLQGALLAAKVVTADQTSEQIESQLCRLIKAADAPEGALALRHWAESAKWEDPVAAQEALKAAEAAKQPKKKVAVEKTAEEKAPAKKAATKKTTKKAPAKKTAVKKAPAKKASTKKTPAKKAPVKKTASKKKAPAKKTTTKKTAAKKAAAKKKTTKKTSRKKA